MALPEKLALLADTLESGEFEQGKTCLRNRNDRYCCLGVACELYRREHPESRWEHTDAGWFFIAGLGDHSTCDLPLAVKSWLGVADVEGDFGMGSLASQNDGGASFDEIAALIRSEPDGLIAS